MNWFSLDVKPGAFFRKIDWAAFWTATGIAFLVYFFTLGPSVTLEDCGELAVAGDHLGVPHPPGYPIWTMCAYLFSRVFSWVTYQGQPTPAWSISLMSAVFAALAAGITAMLITRSASDMVRQIHGDPDDGSRDGENALLCWSGGVGGSLAFAFSPVMWSQATIVEVYTLNAFFLMWIFLLTYRWMRKPSDRILWLTAFVFGLGLTNYQVLLLAAIPLVVVIFLRNVPLFRDFILVGIPILLTTHVLQIGSMMPADKGMKGPAFAKFGALTQVAVPSVTLIVLGLACLFAGLVFAIMMGSLGNGAPSGWRAKMARFREKAPVIATGVVVVGAFLIFLSCIIAGKRTVSDMAAPLLAPSVYVGIAALLVAILAAAVGGACAYKEKWNDPAAMPWLIAAGGLALVLLVRLGMLPTAKVPLAYTGLPFGWGLPTLVLFGGVAMLFILGATIPRGLFYAIPVSALQVAAFVLLRKGAMNGLTHPTTWWFWWPVVWNFVVILLAWLMLPNGRNVALTTFFSELGASFYLYMPIVSDLRNPPMNWGYPRTWDGFKHAITRGQYEQISPANIFDSKFGFQLGFYFTDLRVQFTLIAAVLGFLPGTLWSFRNGAKRFRALYVASGLYLVISALVLISELYHGEPILRLDKVLLAGIGVLLLVGVGGVAVEQITALVRKTYQARSLSESLTVGISLAGGVGAVCLFLTKGLSHYFSLKMALKLGFDLTKQPLPPPTLGMVAGALFLSVLIVALIGLAGYFGYRYIMRELDFTVDMDDVTQQWMIATAAGFLVMSVLLVVLANIKGDLQDAFIQKVKFISSHGLFALWIGYGLAFGLVIASRVVEWFLARQNRTALRRPCQTVLLAMGVCVALIPIYENYNNEWLVFAMSGAEQNDHDFGWQFGNYQLRGAAAIIEELDADEEPLPNPLFPPPMTTNAIFFGGTDPGRFVPTYMIYSADVRPDVYLITQNALADNTYMSTMRDLYGDDIWIPSPDDSAKAFQVYVDEVESGKRSKNADLTIEGGRVQVSGALGVMEINGILCDMIFAKNKARHDFYIEESYVINWMFPYLTPHGLIMKLNGSQAAISQENMEDDMDFWDWYCRHLVRNPMYRRDLPAQKSFSKLRSAIAGLYASRGMKRQAERAFQEACSLYPVSPEANFRLVQEVLLPQARYEEALDLLNVFNAADPNNDKGRSFADFIQEVMEMQGIVVRLTEKERKENKPLSAGELYELARAHQRLGQNDQAAACIQRLADMPGNTVNSLIDIGLFLGVLKKYNEAAAIIDRVFDRLPNDLQPEQLMGLVRIYASVPDPDKMYVPLSRYLQIRKDDWKAWINMATLSAARGQREQIFHSIQSAFMVGGDEAWKSICANPILRPYAEEMVRRARQPIAPNPNNLLGPRL
ncbi:MAG: DUF2723 domain-containing protein [Kiritimatiellae bacterium]|nr:DUF2723 domain-containing protein [Kiritimatiellia bacterium]